MKISFEAKERRLKIAIFQDVWPPEIGGGVTAAHRNLAKLLRKAGHEVRVFTFLSRRADLTDADWVVRQGPPAGIEALGQAAFRNLFRMLDHGKVAYQTGAILSCALGARRHNGALRAFAPDWIVLPDHGAPGLFLDLPKGARTLLIAHHNAARFLDEPLFGIYSARDAGFAGALEQRVLGRIDRVVCPTSYMRGVFEASFRFKGPVEVLPNLVDFETLDALEADDPRPRLGLGPEAPVVYIPSAGSKYKGSRYVFEIVRRLNALQPGKVGFFLSGGVDRQTAAELEAVKPALRVLNPGRLGHDAVLRLVKACSVAVSPTLIENCSMAFLEAMAMGVPVVTFDVGGNAEVVDEGVTGFLVPRLDLEALIGRAATLLDPAARAALGASTRARIRARLAPDLWLPRWFEPV